MSEWTVTFQHPATGEEVTWASPRPLRSDEITAIPRQLWGRDAQVVRRDEYAGEKSLKGRGALGASGTGGVPPVYTPRSQPTMAETAGEVANVASLPVGGGVSTLIRNLLFKSMPRLGSVLGMTAGNAVAGGLPGAVRGNPGEAAFGATVGGAGGAGLASLGLGAKAATIAPGAEMVRDIAAAGGRQGIPGMAKRTTGGSLLDWLTSNKAQRGLNTMYEEGKGAVKPHLPPEAVGGGEAPLDVAGIRRSLGMRAGETFEGLGLDPSRVIGGSLPSASAGKKFNLPAVSKEPLTFDEALEALQSRGPAARTPTATNQPAVKSSIEGWDQFYSELERLGVPPEAVAAFRAMRAKYGATKGYQTVLGGKRAGTISGEEELIPQRVQSNLKTKRGSIERSLGESRDPAAFNDLADKVLRGAMRKDPVTGEMVPAVGQMDIPGQGILGFIRSTIRPTEQGIGARSYLSIPEGSKPILTKYVGAPGRRPSELSPTTVQGLSALIQLLRTGTMAPAAE